MATNTAVIPFAVGIAWRLKMTVLAIPVRDLEQKQDRLARGIEAETRFGVGATFRDRRFHDVMDADWTISPVTKQTKTAPGHNPALAGAGIISSSLACSPRIPNSTISKREPTLRCCRKVAAAALALRFVVITARSHLPNFQICPAN